MVIIDVKKNISFIARLVRYNLSSFAMFLLDLGIIYILTNFFKVYYLISVATGYLTATSVNYLISRRYVFFGRPKKLGCSYCIALSVALGVLAVILAITWFFTTIVGLHYLTSRIIASVIGATLGYILDSKFTFKFPAFSD